MGWNEEKKKSLTFLAAGVLCLAAAGFLLVTFSGRWKSPPSGMVAGPALSMKQTETPSPVPQPTFAPPAEWVLYVTGAVRSPGVYRLPPGARAYQLVERAGGLRPDADSVSINLAMPLGDGMHVHVPAALSVVKGANPHPARAEAPRTNGAAGEAGGRTIRAADAPVDINTATNGELEQLPGIGPKIAAAIVEHRSTNGPFRSIEDLLLVKGIGPKKLEALRNSIVVR